MQIFMLKAKIHRASVTEADLNYEGSISIDSRLLAESKLRAHEKVDIYNCNNGCRFSTYIISGRPGQICINGAAARLVQKGDRIIIAGYALVNEAEAQTHSPIVLIMDAHNRIKRKVKPDPDTM